MPRLQEKFLTSYLQKGDLSGHRKTPEILMHNWLISPLWHIFPVLQDTTYSHVSSFSLYFLKKKGKKLCIVELKFSDPPRKKKEHSHTNMFHGISNLQMKLNAEKNGRWPKKGERSCLSIACITEQSEFQNPHFLELVERTMSISKSAFRVQRVKHLM